MSGEEQLERSHRWGDRSAPVLETTVGGALLAAANLWGHKPALVEGIRDPIDRRRWSFADLAAESRIVASALLKLFEVGEHVAVWAPNGPEWVLIEFGAALAGIILVTVNPAYQEKELEYVLGQSKAVGLLVAPIYRDRDLLAIAERIGCRTPALRHIISLGNWENFVRTGQTPIDLPNVAPDDIAQIQYTSGTTGFPKGALLTHRGLSNNGRFYAKAIGARLGDVWINPMPMFHTAGCGLLTLGALQTGGVHVIPRGFDPLLMLELIQSERGSITLSVPTMLIGMLEHPRLPDFDISSWRLITLGGAPVAPELVLRAQAMTSAKVSIGFGQTEASPYITHTLPSDPDSEWMGTVGKPLPQCEVKIVDQSSHQTLPLGQIGEICTRGYAVMRGYFNDPNATAAALDADGWLHTGDLGSLDLQGYCRIQGRLRDMIIRGGENIYPREIEDLLSQHSMVAEVAVVGVPDPVWGEVPVAFIRPVGETPPKEDELRAFCRQHLAPFKTPRHWRFIVGFPQTPSGKIKKFELRDQFLRENSIPR
jgi:fatty-acyl-CoA synthase